MGDTSSPYSMKPVVKNTIIVLLVVLVAVLLARFVVFKEQFDQMGEGLQRIETWENDYRRANPDATDEQVDAAFEAAIANLKVWQAQYMKDHPDATKAEMDAAFSAMFQAK